MPWIREGECIQCGDCCNSGDPFEGTMEKDLDLMAEVSGACPLLKFHSGKGWCKVRTGEVSKDDHWWIKQYHESACSLWPSVPEHVATYPNCSYSFRWED